LINKLAPQNPKQVISARKAFGFYSPILNTEIEFKT